MKKNEDRSQAGDKFEQVAKAFQIYFRGVQNTAKKLEELGLARFRTQLQERHKNLNKTA